MTEELKPCPFCGSSTYLERYQDEVENWQMLCRNCYARGPLYNSIKTSLLQSEFREWASDAGIALTKEQLESLENTLEFVREQEMYTSDFSVGHNPTKDQINTLETRVRELEDELSRCPSKTRKSFALDLMRFGDECYKNLGNRLYRQETELQGFSIRRRKYDNYS